MMIDLSTKKCAIPEDAIDAARKYFSSGEAFPDEAGVYVGCGDVITTEREMKRQCGSRVGQLVSIARYGFPVYVSRKVAERQ
jgi:hypothetical protein